jgi:hypothetical protein
MYNLGSAKFVAAAVAASSLAVAATSTAASSSLSRTFVGVTQQSPCAHDDSPLCGIINVEMSRGLKSVKAVKVFWEAPCDNGDGSYLSGFTTASRMPLGGRGHSKFRKIGHYQDDLGDGFSGISDATVNGRLNKKRTKASGTFQLTTKVFKDGQQVATCSTGSLRWSADRARKH